MIHAYQKGKMKHAPDKIKDVASHISSTDATHFAETKHKGLREHVKKANQFMNKNSEETLQEYFRNEAPRTRAVLTDPNYSHTSKPVGHYMKEYNDSSWLHPIKKLHSKLHMEDALKQHSENVDEITKKYPKENYHTVKSAHPDEAEDKALIKKIVKPEAIKKEAFEAAFVKEAVLSGVNPITAVQLLKQATAEGVLAGGALGGLTGGAYGAVQGLIPGALIGAGFGAYKESGKEKEQRNYVRALLGGAGKGSLVGAGVGAGVGGTAGGLYGGLAGAALT
jgi:hypothetical protein